MLRVSVLVVEGITVEEEPRDMEIWQCGQVIGVR